MKQTVLLGLAAALIVLWALGWLLLRVASLAIHILLGLGVVLLVGALVVRLRNRVRR